MKGNPQTKKKFMDDLWIKLNFKNARTMTLKAFWDKLTHIPKPTKPKLAIQNHFCPCAEAEFAPSKVFSPFLGGDNQPDSTCIAREIDVWWRQTTEPGWYVRNDVTSDDRRPSLCKCRRKVNKVANVAPSIDAQFQF